ncbi:unnamed protein product [Rotaria socialis]|uniref:BAR domain-containing protein n=2 Tax=Rotaria socialis TaxID=392032 RepID=A0A818N7V6_9BILA|nr:unnamed protein product [Rotaria socialis]CAF3344004.1 unnamed protein product [Rotaria socialis]CAF3601003.1 unnamed protein product [Rotaria socialis]CAF4153083.1 unnamed protein product [Rotaria socialis]CAF4202782.1 unnamed protein product [Rotaria socialis]
MSSWNPFTRNTTSRKSIGVIATRDYDRETRRLESLEESSKSLTRDLIKQDKSFDDFARGQLKLLHDLSGSAFINHYDQQQTSTTLTTNISQLINDWKTTAQHISEQTSLLNEITSKTIIDSSKRLTLALANVTNAIKKREQSLNDYIKIQHKLDKMNEKLGSSTTTLTAAANTANNNKLEQIRKQLNEAKQQYELKNQILNNELPILHEQRAAFVYPCLEAFIEAQAHYCDQLEVAYRNLMGQADVGANSTATLDEINAKLANIKSLSIVASD